MHCASAAAEEGSICFKNRNVGDLINIKLFRVDFRTPAPHKPSMPCPKPALTDEYLRAPMKGRMLHSLHTTAKLIQGRQFCHQCDTSTGLAASKGEKHLI